MTSRDQKPKGKRKYSWRLLCPPWSWLLKCVEVYTLLLVLPILQLWLPCVVSEAVYSCQDTLCTSDPPLHGSAPTLTSYRKGRLYPENGAAVLKLFPEFPPLLPSAPLRKVASTIVPGPLSPWWSLWVIKPSPQGPLAAKSLMEGLLKGTTSHACTPNKSCLLWFETAHVRLGLVQKLQDLPVITS